MNTLKKIVHSISEGLECQAESSHEYPNSKPASPDFNFLVRQNQICAVGWLLFLFGASSRGKLGRSVLKSLPRVTLANASRWKLSAAIDDVVGAMEKARAHEVNEAIVGSPRDGAGQIARRIRRLISLRAIDSAREVLALNSAKLRDHYEPLQERLTRLESGVPASDCGPRVAIRRIENTGKAHPSGLFSETEWRTANQQIANVLIDQESEYAADLDTLLSDVSTDPQRALSLLGFLIHGLDSSYTDQLTDLVLPLAPMARFVILSHWHWADEKLLAKVLEEAISAGRTYNVEQSLFRAMSGRLSPPTKDGAKKQLFEKLLRLATGKAAYGNDPLIDIAKTQGVRALGSEMIPAAYAADQYYKTAPKGTAGGVEPALTSRAKAWLEREAGNNKGTIVLSPHGQKLTFASGRLQVALAGMGKPLQTIVAVAPEAGDSIEASDFLAAARNDGYDITVSGRSLTERNSYSSRYLSFLRSGAVLQIYFDGLLAPGRRLFVPWYLRPAKLPGFPAQLAISSGASVCFAATWIGDDGVQTIDIVPLDPPPRTGSSLVQTLWFTQQLARACRKFALEQQMPVQRQLLAGYGGPLPKRKLVPVETWLQSDTVRQSKLSWLAKHDQDRIAIKTASNSVTYGSLASLCLRMSNMLLHFQDTAPNHTRPDREFGDQHRVLSLLPASPAAVVTQLASTAAGSLLCAGLPEDTDEQLADRLKAFDPDLVMVTFSLWSRLITSHPELENWNALIVGDDCDEPALDFLLQSFSEAPALPALDLRCPAYVVYTSGSSGEPKGVVLAAGMASRMLVFNYDKPQTLLTVVRWDTATALEALPAFVGNHTIVLPPVNGFSDLKQLCDLMIATSTTALSAPCSIIHGMLQNPNFSPKLLPGLTIFFPWGEPSRSRLIRDLVTRFPNAEINACYGATEFIDVSYGKLPAEDFAKYQGSPGGMFLPGTRAINADGEELRPGEIGRVEALGYDRTLGNFKDLQSGAPAFDPLKDPILLEDWVMVQPDGSLDILGRIDDVVNIRGRRLSLNDVAEAAESVTGVARVFVTTILVRDADAVAIAVETKRKDLNVLETELRQVISRKLFAAAAPLQFFHTEELPRLPSGKLDRKRLQRYLVKGYSDSPDLSAPQSPGAAISEIPLPPMLEVLRDFASQEGLVPRTRFDPDNTHPFLDSILSLILMLSIEEKFGRIPVATVFDCQEAATWRELAEELHSSTAQL